MEERNKPTPPTQNDSSLLETMQRIAELPRNCQSEVLERMDILITGITIGYKFGKSA